MKNLILFSDGTGNGAAKRHGTNVWKLYRALDVHRDDQVAFYDDGVGSQEFLPLKVLGGAIGFGLKQNVKDLYKFLCRSYKEGDKIYLFGFSRGAFTVRMLAGMIDCCGLYTEYKDEKDLEERVENNYYILRTHFKQTFISKLFCRFKNIKKNDEGTLYPDIEFIGVWDTVDAYGFPIDEMTYIWDKVFFPIHFPDQILSKKVKKACHALSTDDERHTFHPVLWDESLEEKRANDGEVSSGRIEQVWFAGAHSDVGGGYPRDSLALVTLDWMISKIEVSDENTLGLHFIKEKRKEIHKHSDWHGKQHDPRSGLGSYYRYKPRDIYELCNDDKNKVYIKTPKIHGAVFERIKDRVVSYAPIGIPKDYALESIDSSILEYETAEERENRTIRLKNLNKFIRKRRKLYYMFLFLSFLFIISRCLLPCTDCDKEIFMIPDFAVGWIHALWQNKVSMIAFIITFLVLINRKHSLWLRMKEKAVIAWDHLM